MRVLSHAICIYHLDHERYPLRLDDLVGDYIAKLPLDPWRNAYVYEHPKLWSDGGSGSSIRMTINCAALPSLRSDFP